MADEAVREELAELLYGWGENGGGYRQPGPWPEAHPETRESYRADADKVIEVVERGRG